MGGDVDIKAQARRAMAHLRAGGLAMGPDWERAHEICQGHEGTRDHDLVHALCHWIEGDISNRDYWYRAVPGWTPAGSIAEEWQAIMAALL